MFKYAELYDNPPVVNPSRQRAWQKAFHQITPWRYPPCRLPRRENLKTGTNPYSWSYTTRGGAISGESNLKGIISAHWQKVMPACLRAPVNPLESTSNNMKLAHWPLMGGLLHLVQRGGAWEGLYQSPCCCIMVRCSTIMGIKGLTNRWRRRLYSDGQSVICLRHFCLRPDSSRHYQPRTALHYSQYINTGGL